MILFHTLSTICFAWITYALWAGYPLNRLAKAWITMALFVVPFAFLNMVFP